MRVVLCGGVWGESVWVVCGLVVWWGGVVVVGLMGVVWWVVGGIKRSQSMDSNWLSCWWGVWVCGVVGGCGLGWMV